MQTRKNFYLPNSLLFAHKFNNPFCKISYSSLTHTLFIFLFHAFSTFLFYCLFSFIFCIYLFPFIYLDISIFFFSLYFYIRQIKSSVACVCVFVCSLKSQKMVVHLDHENCRNIRFIILGQAFN